MSHPSILDSIGAMFGDDTANSGDAKPPEDSIVFRQSLRTTSGGEVFVVEMPSAATLTAESRFVHSFDPIVAAQPRVIVDMNRLARIDSCGLAVMLGLLKQIGEAGGILKLCELTKSVQIVFELTRLHHVFDIYGSVDEALQAFEQ